MYSAQKCPDITRSGFPHSDIPGSKLICSSPGLIAAYHVLHRLLVPRHPPYALCNLTKNPKALHTLHPKGAQRVGRCSLRLFSFQRTKYRLRTDFSGRANFQYTGRVLKRKPYFKLSKLFRPVWTSPTPCGQRRWLKKGNTERRNSPLFWANYPPEGWCCPSRRDGRQ